MRASALPNHPVSPNPFSLFPGSFSRDNMEAHPAIQQLTKCLDLEHSCGYISLLNPSSNTKLFRDARRPASAAVGLDASPSGSTRTFSPLIVVEDLTADSTNDVDVATELTDESVDCRSSDEMVVVGEGRRSSEKSSDWVPLDLCFGVPLFDSKLSGEVCERVCRAHFLFKNDTVAE